MNYKFIYIIILILCSFNSLALLTTETSEILPYPPYYDTNLSGVCNVTDTNSGSLLYEYKWYNNSIEYLYSSDDAWNVNNTIISGLENVGGWASISVFNYSGELRIIAGNRSGLFKGFQWNGSGWTENSSIVTGLPDIGSVADPAVFYESGSWKIIVGESTGDWNSYIWNGATWLVDNTIKNGLVNVDDYSRSTIFNYSGILRIITGSSSGFLIGYQWNGTEWITNTSLTNGIGDLGNRPAPSVYLDDTTWKMIVSTDNSDLLEPPVYLGYQWNGTTWISTDILVSGLITFPDRSNLRSVVYNDGNQFQILIGEFDNIYYGYTFNTTISEGVERNVSILNYTDTSIDDEWIFSCRAYNGTAFSSWVNSSTATILNYAIFNLIDEVTYNVFNISRPDSIDLKVFCPSETINYNINTTTTVIPITCDYQYMRFFLYFTIGTESVQYYRSVIDDNIGIFDYDIYLMDITETDYIINTFKIDDLLGEYDNVSIYVKKRIPAGTVLITADSVDINNKIGAYLIENDEYIIEVHSVNLPTRIFGTYIAYSSGEKVLRLYEMAIETDGHSFQKDVSYVVSTYNSTINNQTHFIGSYSDVGNLTENVTFYVWRDEFNTTLLYNKTFTTGFIAGVSTTYNISQYENYTLYGSIEIHYQGNQILYIKLLQAGQKIVLGIFKYVNMTFMNWFILLLMSALAVSATIKSANMASLALIGLSALLVMFGWFTVSISILGLTLLISVLTILKDGTKG